MLNKKKVVFIYCEEKFGLEGNTHQHIINEASKLYEVVFVGPVKRSNILDLFKKVNLQRLNDNIYGLRYTAFVPFFLSYIIPKKVILYINDNINYYKWRKLIKNKKIDFSIFFDPTKGLFIPSKKKIYYVLDPYFQRPYDKLFSKLSNKIIVVNSDMGRRYFPYKEKVSLVPHGVPDTNISYDEVEQIKLKYGDYVLLLGTISELIDFDLLIDLVKSNQKTLFLVVGKNVTNSKQNLDLWNRLLQFNNFKYIGLVKYDLIDNYISASKLCLIVYKNEKLKYRNPIKITNYLANNKLIINSFKLNDLNILEGKVLYTAKNSVDFKYLFQKGINGGLTIDKKFIEGYIEQYSYKKILFEITEGN